VPLTSRRGLFALALAGGIVPAPSALLVLLSAVSAHRTLYGLALILAFSLGLAAALILMGLGAISARDALARRMSSTMGRLVPGALGRSHHRGRPVLHGAKHRAAADLAANDARDRAHTADEGRGYRRITRINPG
jgi:hypothetical protein